VNDDNPYPGLDDCLALLATNEIYFLFVPQREEILICGAGFNCIPMQDVGAGEMG
jgi:hypothetical protein